MKFNSFACRMKSSIFLLLLVSLSKLAPSPGGAVHDNGCDVTFCQAGEFEWPVERGNEEQLDELVAKLRCRIACEEEINSGLQEPSDLSSADEEVDQCTEGCMSQFRNATLSADQCLDLCENIVPCRIGCTVYEQFIREEPLLSSGSAGCTLVNSTEFTFVSAGPNCEIYSCNNSDLGPTEVPCSTLGDSIENCSLSTTEDSVAFGLARCCHMCGVPSTPVSPPVVELTSNGRGQEYIATVPANYNTSSGVIVFRVQEKLSMNVTNTSYVYFSEFDALVEGLLLPPCSDISLSFAVINKFGISGYSPEADKCTFLPIGPPQILEIEFEEDFRTTYLGHAVLNISWQQPEGHENLAYYELFVESVDERFVNRTLCTQQTTLRIEISNNVSNYILRAENNNTSSPPHFDCSYRFTMRSHPGSENTSIDYQVQYVGRRPRLDLSCHARFNTTTNKYVLIAEWTVPNLLVLEAIFNFRTELFRFPPGGVLPAPGSQINFTQKSGEMLQYSFIYPDQNILIRDRQGIYDLVVLPELQPKRDGIRHLFWRSPLVPRTTSCILEAPPIAPSTITNITAQNITLFEESEVVELTVKWEPPLSPNGVIQTYQLRLGREEIPPTANDFQGQLSYRTVIQPTEQNEAVIEEFVPFLFEPGSNEIFHVQMRAENEFFFSNWSESLQLNASEYLIPANPTVLQDDPLPLFAYILFGITGLIVFAAVTIPICVGFYHFFICCPGARCYEDPEPPYYKGRSKPPFEPPVLPIPDMWEISSDELEVYESQPLGKGQFGEVFKGLLRGQPARKRSSVRGRNKSPKYSMTHTVAIKKLKKNALSPEKAAFLKEINMMKQVSDTDDGLSRFVVNMLGCVTGREPLLLVLEYIRHGDLLSYLRSMRKQAEAAYFNPLTEAASPYLEPNGVYSQLAPMGAEQYADLGVLEERNLLEFARQIAAGMEFLASMDIIHRDLACRNILVGENKHLKISDFGMSRLVPADEVYVNTTHGLLPLRWMALESIFYRKFTTLSDVWSYGIALWEICTLGGFPFPTLSNKELPSFLKHGYRMEKPPNCSQEVYEVMLLCWNDEPEQRPKFSQLHDVFDQFLSRHTQDKYPYMELQTNPPYTFDKLEPLSNTTNQDNAPVNLDMAGEEPTVRLRATDNRLTGTHSLQLPVPENRLSTLSERSLRWGSDQDIRLMDTEIDRISQFSMSMEKEPDSRYVESPVPPRDRTSMLIVPDISIKDELIAHLERRLSNLGSRNHLRVQSDCLDLACSIDDDSSPGELYPPRRGGLSLSVPEVRYQNMDVCTCKEYHGNEGEHNEREEKTIFRETDI